jgi:glutaminase
MTNSPPTPDYPALLKRIAVASGPAADQGQVADYIPALARVPADRFGMALQTLSGSLHRQGDADEPFSIQSISKIFTLTLAMGLVGEDLWRRVGREPSGNPFNSLVQLEREHGIPRNPFINAGALNVADLLVSRLDRPAAALRELVSELCGESVHIDAEVAASERAASDRNAALAHFMKSFGNLDNDVDDVLDFYVQHCALALSCAQLARATAYLAHDGLCPRTGRRILDPRQARRLNAIMLTCGTYDAAGDFAFEVGLPCKSGVGGGIVAVAPGQLTAAVWSPALGPSGNSVAGQQALERLVAETGLSVF